MSAAGFIRQAIQPVPRFMVSLLASGLRPAAFRRAVLEAVNLITKPLTYRPALMLYGIAQSRVGQPLTARFFFIDDMAPCFFKRIILQI